MFYKRNTTRWEIDKKALPPLTAPTENPAVSAQPTVPAPPPQVPINPVHGSNDTRKSGKELAMSNYTHQINLAMKGLTNVMRDSWWVGPLFRRTGVSLTHKKDPGRVSQYWSSYCCFMFLLFALCPSQCQFWQNIMMWLIGYCFKGTYDWELNRKRGKEVGFRIWVKRRSSSSWRRNQEYHLIQSKTYRRNTKWWNHMIFSWKNGKRNWVRNGFDA
jgi:hypothetical protein